MCALKMSRRRVLSCPVLSCPVLSCPVLSCPVLSCPVLSCPVLSCPVLSCPVLSCPVRVLSCPVHAAFLVVCCSVFVFASDFCLFVSTQGVGVLRSLLSSSSFEHTSMSPSIDRHSGPHSVCNPCSRAHFGRATTARVLSPCDWAVSMGSRMQQDMGISQAPRHLGAPFQSASNRSRH